MVRTRLLVSFWGICLLACGEVGDANYRGDPLITLQGDLALSDPSLADTPIRLAVLWYSVQDPFSSTNPPAIVSADVRYKGEFPISYTFSLYEPPPAGALTPFRYGGQTIQRATGIITAYRDDNRNGQLDIIPTDQAPMDTVLGVSMPSNGDPYSSDAYTLTYYDQTVPSTESLAGGTAGFHLRRAGRDLPADARVPIQLTGAPDLNLFVCAQLFSAPQVVPQPGTACAVQPARPLLQVVGVAGNHQSFFTVTQGTLPVSNAQVEVDGNSLSLDPTLGIFSQPGLLPGKHTFIATAPGLGAASGDFEVMAPLSIQAPVRSQAAGERMAVLASWLPVPSATGYHVYIYESGEQIDAVYDEFTSGTTLETPRLEVDTPPAVIVAAYGPTTINDTIDTNANLEVLTQITTTSESVAEMGQSIPAPRSPDEAQLLHRRGSFAP